MRDAMQRINEDGTAGLSIEEIKNAILNNVRSRNANWQEAGPRGIAAENTSPNILGWSGNSSEAGGQYYYDLRLVHLLQMPIEFCAGISVWSSLNAGQSWELNGHWVTWASENTMERYTHANVHDINFTE